MIARGFRPAAGALNAASVVVLAARKYLNFRLSATLVDISCFILRSQSVSNPHAARNRVQFHPPSQNVFSVFIFLYLCRHTVYTRYDFQESTPQRGNKKTLLHVNFVFFIN